MDYIYIFFIVIHRYNNLVLLNPATLLDILKCFRIVQGTNTEICFVIFDRNQSALLNRKLPQGDLLQKTSELYIHSNKTSQTEQKTGLSLHFFYIIRINKI